jgi:hypothetical protein
MVTSVDLFSHLTCAPSPACERMEVVFVQTGGTIDNNDYPRCACWRLSRQMRWGWHRDGSAVFLQGA